MTYVRTCEKCIWWRAYSSESEYGNCHLNPPTVRARGSHWPETWMHEFCSQFSPKVDDAVRS
jgi:hypothetical protein